MQFAFDRWHELKPDLIHVHDFDSLQIGCMLRTAFAIPLGLTVHRAPTEWRPRRYCENARDCFLEAARVHRIVDRIVVPSAASRVVLRAQGFRGVEVIPHGISRHLLSFESDPSILEALNLPEDSALIFCPVRADEHKDPAILIRATQLLKGRLERRVVLVVTSEPEEPTSDEALAAKELRVIASVYGLREGQDVFFTRPFEYGVHLATIYRRAAAVVVPSLHESFGQNVLDAFMFGKPVVVRNSMALPDIVRHEEEGLLFTTAGDLANQLLRVLVDNELVMELVERGKSRLAKQYSVERMARDYRVLYDRALRKRKA